VPTSSTSPVRPARWRPGVRGRRGPGCGRSCSACSTRSRRPRSSAPSTATTSPPTRSAAPCTHRCSRASKAPANSARFTFLDPAAADFYPEWDRLATELVASLRSQAGRNPHDRNLHDLIGELSKRSDAFRVRWAAHNVRFHRTGTKRLHHPVVGELELSYETLTVDADDGLRMALYTAEPDSASQQALDLLASWSAEPTALREP
jgi:hypothetical protein